MSGKRAKTTYDISGYRWNQIINAVNHRQKPEVISPSLDEVELEQFYKMEKYKKEEDEKYGLDLCYAPVEIDFDDPCLDIYHEESWKRK